MVKFTRLGRAMRSVAQNPTAARLMGVNVDQIIGVTFIVGGALGGFASVINALYIGTISFQMGFRAAWMRSRRRCWAALATCPARCWAGS
jgi:branched-chain amino acid transport system permease protein